MKNCDEYLEKISCLIDGELDDSEKQDVLNHIAACEACRNFYETFGAVSLEISEDETAVPDGFAQSVMAEIRRTKKKNIVSIRKITGLAAGILLVIGISAVFAFDTGLIGGRGGGADLSYNESAQTKIEEAQDSAENDAGFYVKSGENNGESGFADENGDFEIFDARLYSGDFTLGDSMPFASSVYALQEQNFPTSEKLLYENRMMWDELTMLKSWN